MAKVVGDIAIQVGADIGPLVRDLGRAKGAVSGFGGSVDRMASGFKGAAVAGTAIGAAVVAAGVAIAGLTKRALDNVDALSKQARAAGVSVASFQAMAMVAGEAGVESDKLSGLLVKMQKNIASLGQGATSQVDSFSRLGLSFSDLGGLRADEQFKKIAEAISSISDPTTKTAAALDVFGKAGADALNIVDGYGAAVENAAKFQRDFGIAVSDVDAAQIEAANDAMGRLGMAVDGLGNSLAVTFAPAITSAANGLTEFIVSLQTSEKGLNAIFGSAERAKSILGDDLFGKLLVSPDDVDASVSALGRASVAYEDLGRTVHTTAEAVSNDAQALFDVGADELAVQLVDVGARMDDVIARFNAGKIGVEEMGKELGAATVEAQRLLDEASKIDGVDMGDAINQVGLLSKAMAFATGVAQTLIASLPGAAAPAPLTGPPLGSQPGAPTGAIVGTSRAPTSSPRPQAAPFFDGFDTGGGGGGGGGDSLQAKLDKMRADFNTEQVLIDDQYQKQLEQLAEFRDKKLITQKEYNDLEQQAATEHADKLSAIDADAMNARLSAISGAFGDLSSLMQSHNKKLFKIGQAAAIAQAAVSGYQAAVDAWAKGMKIGGPPMAAAFAAASLAKTGALIASMKSQPDSGGGGSTSSAGGGGTPSGGSGGGPSTYVSVQLTGGDSFGVTQVRGLISAINKEIESGAVIKGIRAV